MAEYRIKRGDTLGGIANKFHVPLDRLFGANREEIIAEQKRRWGSHPPSWAKIGSPDWIFEDAKLSIPERARMRRG